MTKGEGLVALLYAFKGILEAGAIWVITGVGILAFFYLISGFIASKTGLNLPWTAGMQGKDGGKRIMMALFVLFVIFAIYPLIALVAAVFGVNSSPSGGLFIQ